MDGGEFSVVSMLNTVNFAMEGNDPRFFAFRLHGLGRGRADFLRRRLRWLLCRRNVSALVHGKVDGDQRQDGADGKAAARLDDSKECNALL